MGKNEKVALEILDEIDRARAGNLSLDELEHNLWRLLETTEPGFPNVLASRVENLVQELRDLHRENLAFARGAEVDEKQGSDTIYHEVTSAIGRFIG